MLQASTTWANLVIVLAYSVKLSEVLGELRVLCDEVRSAHSFDCSARYNWPQKVEKVRQFYPVITNRNLFNLFYQGSLKTLGGSYQAGASKAVNGCFVHKIKGSIFRPGKTVGGKRVVGNTWIIGFKELHVILWSTEHVRQCYVDSICWGEFLMLFQTALRYSAPDTTYTSFLNIQTRTTVDAPKRCLYFYISTSQTFLRYWLR